MAILKKWIGCVISFVAGVCGLVLSACSGMVVKGSIDASQLGMEPQSINKTTKAFKVITDSSLYSDAKELGLGTEFIWLKIFAIITLIVSVLLVVYSIISLLQNLNVIKSSHIAFDIVGISLVALLLVSTIGLLVTTNVYASGTEEKMLNMMSLEFGNYASLVDINLNIKHGIYQPAMLTISIITAIVTSTFTFLKRKSA